MFRHRWLETVRLGSLFGRRASLAALVGITIANISQELSFFLPQTFSECGGS